MKKGSAILINSSKMSNWKVEEIRAVLRGIVFGVGTWGVTVLSQQRSMVWWDMWFGILVCCLVVFGPNWSRKRIGGWARLSSHVRWGTYYDIWEVQVEGVDESYLQYYGYTWWNWHELEVRILWFLCLRILFVGI